MNYKTISTHEVLDNIYFPSNNNQRIYTKSQKDDLVEMPRKIGENHFKFDKIISYFDELFSTDDKLILLQQIRDEVSELKLSLYEYLKDKQILDELLKIFDLGNISYSKQVLKIFQNLLIKTHECASFITLNENNFYPLLEVEELNYDLIVLFTKVINIIPDFSDNLHSNNIISIIYIICSHFEEKFDANLIQSISIFLKTMIEKEKLFSNVYETSESRLDISNKLVYITHSLISFMDYSEKKSKSKRKIIKKTDEFYFSIRNSIFLLLDSLLYSELSSLQQLFDLNTGIFIYEYISEGEYLKEISIILISIAKKFPIDCESFFDQFDLIYPLFRLGLVASYQWYVIDIFIHCALVSSTISDLIYQYGFIEKFEDEFENYEVEKKEKFLRLFLIFCINVPQLIVSKKNLTIYFELSIDIVDYADDSFTILYIRAVDSLMKQPDFSLDFIIDYSELGEKLDYLASNSENEEIVALCREVLPNLP